MNKMRMTGAAMAVLMLLWVCPACGQTGHDKFTVSGQLKGIKDSAVVHLQYRYRDSSYRQKTRVRDGRFAFTGHVAEPVMAELHTGSYSMRLKFYLENSAIHLSGTIAKPNGIVVSGSATQREYEDYLKLTSEVSGEEHRLTKAFGKADDRALQKAINDTLNAVYDREDSLSIQYIKQHPNSFVSLDQLERLVFRLDYDPVEKLYRGLGAAIRHSGQGAALAATMKEMSRLKTGMQAPDFTLDNENGEPVSLHDFRGKFVLIDFWASWCTFCRAGNPDLIRIYHQYKDKGFTIFGVSLDFFPASWKKAVAEDKLTWPQAIDNRGGKNKVSSLYLVRLIPANYLIGPDGKIIARNLEGAALDKKLAEVLR